MTLVTAAEPVAPRVPGPDPPPTGSSRGSAGVRDRQAADDVAIVAAMAAGDGDALAEL
jgi:hypothetical protein